MLEHKDHFVTHFIQFNEEFSGAVIEFNRVNILVCNYSYIPHGEFYCEKGKEEKTFSHISSQIS